MLIVFTGDGKGKTTAALGQAVRAVGRGKSVLMVQFIKGPWKSGEDFIELKERETGSGKFELKKMGLGFVGILGDTLKKEQHAEAARNALAYINAEYAAHDVVILDEVNVAVSLGLLEPQEVLAVAEKIPHEKLVILTGRGAPQGFIEKADLVTEMKEVKHPFGDGKKGEIAIEF